MTTRNRSHKRPVFSRLLCAGSLAVLLGPAARSAEHLYFFGEGGPPAKGVRVSADTRFDPGRGHGFLNPGDDQEVRLFAVELGEGNYDVTVKLGDPAEATNTTIKAEARRLMLHGVETKRGELVTQRFTVNVRQPRFGEGQKVGLKTREYGPPLHPSWDEMLTLEFNGERPGVAAVEITANPEATTVFLAGDSTVTDQRNEPWSGWGQMLPRFFEPGVAVSNHAESGLALFSFAGQRRLQKILSMMKEGDYLFIQFGHNDQKDRREGSGAFTTYKKELGEFIDAFREKGGKPVLVTPMERRRWSGGKPGQTLTDYAEAVRQVGEEKKVPVIDLHAMSLELYTALGPDDSRRAFVHYPANTFPYQGRELKDDTHHNAYGGYELARCMVEGIKFQVPELAKHLRDDVGTFDPAKPDQPGDVVIPLTPVIGENETPDGN